MKIKNRLALHFTFISTGLLLVVLVSVYLIFLKFLQADFYARLNDRTMVTAKLYLEADEISRDSLNKVRDQYLDKLSDEVIRIYDSKDNASFIGDRSQHWTTSTINRVRKAGKIQIQDGKQQVVGIFYKDNQGDFVILAAATDQSSIYRLNKLFKIMLATFVVFSLLLLFTGRWIAERSLQPLNFLMKEVKKVGSSNLEFRVKESNTNDEIDELAQTFNRLMEELEQAFILQKTFVANASHELRTPITRVVMTAEFALTKERQIEEYQEHLKSILEDTSKMNYTITGLLTLAKLDLELGTAHLNQLRISDVLLNIKHEWKKLHDLEVNLSVKDRDNDNLIMANEVLLLIALNNIVSNAFKFSNNQTVTAELKSDENHVIVSFTDAGIGISQADLSEIFKPFYSRAEQIGKNGEGMGLYLSGKIINLFKGEITVNSVTHTGTTFTIKLPKL